MMSAQKCVVEGCNLEYDVVCSFSFYNANISSENETRRQEWIEGAMQEESECLWRHVSLQLCGYHFELDTQGLWIDSPMLPELLTLQEKIAPHVQSPENKKVLDTIRLEHNYSVEPQKGDPNENVSRLNVRQLVDTLGYLSLKNLQRKQLWVVKVETDKSEASITQAEQVITKMQDPKQIIEIIPQASGGETSTSQAEVLQIMEEDTAITDNFIYEIAQEQEITMEEVKEIPSENQEWMVNIIPEDARPRYAYIKHTSGRKKRHFTADINEITLPGNFENYYILPDVDPSVGVEITTSYEPENYIVEEYQHLVLEERPRKRSKDTPESSKKRKKRFSAVREQVKQIQVRAEEEDWVIDNNISYEQEAEEYEDPKKARTITAEGKISRRRRQTDDYEDYALPDIS